MPKHEFGRMERAPQAGERYEAYEPERYACVAVEDDDMAAVLAAFAGADCCWHALERVEKGLAYSGVTLIPPAACGAGRRALGDGAAYRPLKALLKQAERDGKYVIHFGI